MKKEIESSIGSLKIANDLAVSKRIQEFQNDSDEDDLAKWHLDA